MERTNSGNTSFSFSRGKGHLPPHHPHTLHTDVCVLYTPPHPHSQEEWLGNVEIKLKAVWLSVYKKTSMEITDLVYSYLTFSIYIASRWPPLEQETISMTAAGSTMSPQHATLPHKELWAQPPTCSEYVTSRHLVSTPTWPLFYFASGYYRSLTWRKDSQFFLKF